MAAFTPERRVVENRSMIPPTGDRRRNIFRSRDENRDPAAAGSVAGPAGAAAGAAVDPTAEEAYWRENYSREPYYERGYTFVDYYPAYRIGWEARVRYQGRSFDEVERELQREYQRNRGNSQLDWSRNRHAARAAWERFDRTDDFERSQ